MLEQGWETPGVAGAPPGGAGFALFFSMGADWASRGGDGGLEDHQRL